MAAEPSSSLTETPRKGPTSRGQPVGGWPASRDKFPARRLLRKLQFNIGLPRELESLSGQLDGLSSVLARVQSPASKIEQALDAQVPRNYRNQISHLMNTTASQLTR